MAVASQARSHGRSEALDHHEEGYGELVIAGCAAAERFSLEKRRLIRFRSRQSRLLKHGLHSRPRFGTMLGVESAA